MGEPQSRRQWARRQTSIDRAKRVDHLTGQYNPFSEVRVFLHEVETWANSELLDLLLLTFDNMRTRDAVTSVPASSGPRASS